MHLHLRLTTNSISVRLSRGLFTINFFGIETLYPSMSDEFLSVELIAFAKALIFVLVPNAVSVYAWQQGASKLSLLSENDLVPKYKIKWSAKKMRLSPK